MKLRDWEVTIQQMVEESNREPKESGKYRVLTRWRAKLAQEPYRLQLYQIDEIVREYRNRLTSVALQTGSLSPAHLAISSTSRPVPDPECTRPGSPPEPVASIRSTVSASLLSSTVAVVTTPMGRVASRSVRTRSWTG